MKTIGILAHVDAGKTTLSEQILYQCGARRTCGRVDHQDTLLDHDPIERRRGITIFADQSAFSHHGTDYTLVDTPGHSDFAPEMERTLGILDGAVLVISAPAGVQAHTETLWGLLRTRRIPTFFFFNKCDFDGVEPETAMARTEKRLSAPLADLTDGLTEEAREKIALTDETLLERYLSGEAAEDDFWQAAARAVLAGALYPAVRGSALRGDGVEPLLTCLDRLLTVQYDPAKPLEAVAYKIRHDAKGDRVTFLKVLSGTLRAKQPVGDEKINELRAYAGEKYTPVPEVQAGGLCAVTGLREIRAGQTLSGTCRERETLMPLLESRVEFPETVTAVRMLEILRILEDEEPTLRVRWNEELQELHVALMGEIQTEVLQEILSTRFGVEARFSPPEVLYRETVAKPVMGCGHYEPLRHYAEVHLEIAPGPPGSGVVFASRVPTDDLALNWQRLIETHVMEKPHVGVLVGAPLTDVKITLLAARDHLKHTEGGDFRQATYRAIRQGLFHSESVLLEPMYAFCFRVEPTLTGRIISDVQTMCGTCEVPVTEGEFTVIRGRAPVSELIQYSRGFAAMTRGRGSLTLRFDGYAPCHDAAAAVERLAYDRDGDKANPAGSVFCDHGAGFYVPWDEAPGYMHIKGVKA